MKLCYDCGQEKPTTGFYHYAGKPYTPCKICRTAKVRERYQAREQERQYLRTIVAAVQAQVPYLGGDLA